MADILLVHGSWHGAWCWRDLLPELAELGHDAHAIDLPSHGSDPTPVSDVTLEMCRDAVLAASSPDTIVLGHSWGGYPISAAAESDPQAMRGLIYLCAYVPQSGLSMVDMRKRGPRQLLDGALEKSSDGLSCTVRPDRVQDLFYHDCPANTLPFAFARLCPQAILPQDTPLTLSTRFGQVPKAYIRCTDDRTIPPEYQEEMSRCATPEMRHNIDSSHSPFFACPRDLAGIIDQITRAF